jgi:hypothetical protein
MGWTDMYGKCNFTAIMKFKLLKYINYRIQ